MGWIRKVFHSEQLTKAWAYCLVFNINIDFSVPWISRGSIEYLKCFEHSIAHGSIRRFALCPVGEDCLHRVAGQSRLWQERIDKLSLIGRNGAHRPVDGHIPRFCCHFIACCIGHSIPYNGDGFLVVPGSSDVLRGIIGYRTVC